MTTTSGGALKAGSSNQEITVHENHCSLEVSASDKGTLPESAHHPNHLKSVEITSAMDQVLLRNELSHQYHQTEIKLDAIEARTTAVELALSGYDDRDAFLEILSPYRRPSGVLVPIVLDVQNAQLLRDAHLVKSFSEKTRRIGTSAISGLQTSFDELGILEKEIDSLVKKIKVIDFEPGLTAEEIEQLRGLEDSFNLAKSRKGGILILVRSYW